MAVELFDGLAVLEVPESEGLVPRRRQNEVVILRKSKVRDEVVVSSELSIRNTGFSIFASFFE